MHAFLLKCVLTFFRVWVVKMSEENTLWYEENTVETIKIKSISNLLQSKVLTSWNKVKKICKWVSNFLCTLECSMVYLIWKVIFGDEISLLYTSVGTLSTNFWTFSVILQAKSLLIHHQTMNWKLPKDPEIPLYVKEIV